MGNSTVVGARDRETGQVAVNPIRFAEKPLLQGLVLERADPGSAVYSEEHAAHLGVDNSLYEVA